MHRKLLSVVVLMWVLVVLNSPCAMAQDAAEMRRLAEAADEIHDWLENRADNIDNTVERELEVWQLAVRRLLGLSDGDIVSLMQYPFMAYLVYRVRRRDA